MSKKGVVLTSMVRRGWLPTGVLKSALFRGKRLLETAENYLKDGDFLIYLLIIGFTSLYSYMAIVRYYTFGFHGWYDLGVFNQSLWTTLHYGIVNGQILWNTTNFGQLPIHLSLTLLLYLPFYAVYPGPETILVLGSFMLRLAALPLYWLARDEFNSKRVGLFFALIYLTYGLQLGTSWMFHPDAAMPAFLLFSFYFLKKRDWRKYFLFLVLALMTKEIVPLVTIPLGIYGLVSNRAKLGSVIRRKFSDPDVIYPIFTIVLSASWFVMASWVINYFVSTSLWATLGNPHNLPWSNFGDTPTGMFTGILLNPGYAISVLVTNILSTNPYENIPNYIYLVRLLAPLAFTPLLSLTTMFIPIPYILFLLISNEPYYQRIAMHYAAPVIPFMFISAVYGVKRLTTRNLRILKGEKREREDSK